MTLPLELRPYQFCTTRHIKMGSTNNTVISALPTICPAINCKEPKASHRKRALSITNPTMFDRVTAPNQDLLLSGVYTKKSLASDTRNVIPDASAKVGDTRADSA